MRFAIGILCASLALGATVVLPATASPAAISPQSNPLSDLSESSHVSTLEKRQQRGQGGQQKGQGGQQKRQGGQQKGQGVQKKGQGGKQEGQGAQKKGQGAQKKGQGGKQKGQGAQKKGQGVQQKGQGVQQKGQGGKEGKGGQQKGQQKGKGAQQNLLKAGKQKFLAGGQQKGKGGEAKGADMKNNAVARKMDQKDKEANDKAAKGQKGATKATGGRGGIDPSTGEKLQPLPPASGFCKSTKEGLSDGTQKKGGSCSSLPQGQLPAVTKMVSTIILTPENGAKLSAKQGFTVSFQTKNLQTGFFSDAEKEYYTQPQTLNRKGEIKGHQHVTIQNIGNGKTAPDAQTPDFFKGANDAANGNGVLNVDVPPLNKTGNYRICTMSGGFSHQPVVMPVAKRGGQDDCIRVQVQ